MEQRCFLQPFFPNILPGIHVIGSWIVQKNPVQSRNGKGHRIGSGTVSVHHNSLLCPVALHNLKNQPPQLIIPHFPHHLHRGSQLL